MSSNSKDRRIYKWTSSIVRSKSHTWEIEMTTVSRSQVATARDAGDGLASYIACVHCLWLEQCTQGMYRMDRYASYVHLTKMRSVLLIHCLPKMPPSSSTSTSSQIATWRRSLTCERYGLSAFYHLNYCYYVVYSSIHCLVVSFANFGCAWYFRTWNL